MTHRGHDPHTVAPGMGFSYHTSWLLLESSKSMSPSPSMSTRRVPWPARLGKWLLSSRDQIVGGVAADHMLRPQRRGRVAALLQRVLVPAGRKVDAADEDVDVAITVHIGGLGLLAIAPGVDLVLRPRRVGVPEQALAGGVDD